MHQSIKDVIDQHKQNWQDHFDPLLTPYFLTLHRAHGMQLGRAIKVMVRFGFTPGEFDVLASLRRSPWPHELTPSQIQHALLITSGGLTKILQQLELRGLISRSTDAKDRRSKPVRLTKAAFEVIESAMQEIMHQVGGWIQNRLSAEEIRQVTVILNQLIQEPLGEAEQIE